MIEPGLVAQQARLAPAVGGAVRRRTARVGVPGRHGCETVIARDGHRRWNEDGNTPGAELPVEIIPPAVRDIGGGYAARVIRARARDLEQEVPRYEYRGRARRSRAVTQLPLAVVSPAVQGVPGRHAAAVIASGRNARELLPARDAYGGEAPGL